MTKESPPIDSTVIALLKQAKTVDAKKADGVLYDLCLKLGVGNTACFLANKLYDSKPQNLDENDIAVLAKSLANCDLDGNGKLTVGEIRHGTKNSPELAKALNKLIPALDLPIPKASGNQASR